MRMLALFLLLLLTGAARAGAICVTGAGSTPPMITALDASGKVVNFTHGGIGYGHAVPAAKPNQAYSVACYLYTAHGGAAAEGVSYAESTLK